jgi:ectoine hydroxylase-related dioxygenase (phytanoyl-CoA dioxygenase family)
MKKLKMGACEFEAESKYLTLKLCESNDLIGTPTELRKRIKEDGYLFFRDFHNRDEVLNVRQEILQKMAKNGQLDPRKDIMEGEINPSLATTSASVRNSEGLICESLKQLMYGPRVLKFFDLFLGGESIGLQNQWLRIPGKGSTTGIHSDIVYMGRGTKDLYSCWTPIGDTTVEMGPLVICLGSHRWQKVIDTYGKSDVDRDLTEGVFTRDPAELVEQFGGQWATTDFKAGDAIIFDLFLLHGSLTNTTSKYRISCDTRYQLKSSPIDDRWAGLKPIGHSDLWKKGKQNEPVEISRQKWKV